MKVFKASLLISTLFLFACSAEVTNTPGQIEIKQLQRQWILTAINETPVTATIESSLTVDTQAKATGNLACNRFFGTLELQNNHLRIAKMGTTRRMCQDKINAVEKPVSTVLGDWSKVQLTDNQLILSGKKDKLSYRIKVPN